MLIAYALTRDFWGILELFFGEGEASPYAAMGYMR